MKTNATLNSTSYVRHLLESVFGVFAAAWMLGISHAGTNTYYFNSPGSTNGPTIFSQAGDGYSQPSGGTYLQSSDGSPNDPEATDPSTNGYFVITDSVQSQRGIIIFPGFDSGLVVKAFRFTCDVRIGAGPSVPADGFSICFAPTNDPVLVNNNGSGWASGPCSGPADDPEEGTQTGLAVCFDAWDSDCGDVIGLTIRVDNTTVKNVSLPFANLAPSDPNFAASLQTGTNDVGLAGLTWQPVSVEYTTNCLLNVAYKGVTLLTNFVTPFSPTAGRFILGGRTGASYQNHHFDNLRIVTIPTTSPTVGPPFGNAYGFTISIHDSGAATPDTNTITVQLDGVTIISHGTNVSSQTAAVSRGGVTTTIAYSQSAPFGLGSSHSVRVTFSGTGFSGTVDETRAFVAPTAHYVNVNSVSPTPPYTTWAAAATNIQQAVDVAEAGDEVVVTNGVYVGGVAMDKPLTLRSLNGPQVTVVDGGGANRCASLSDGASLSGFTLTNGVASDGGGVWCASTNAFVTNCVMMGNSVSYYYGYGGGAYGGTLYNCTLSGNSAYGYSFGGGAYGCTLHNCTLNSNSAGSGGGVYQSTLYNCTLTGNPDGGACYSTLHNCRLSGNSGYGANSCMLYNCALSRNFGYGAYYGTLNNCTLTGNSSGGAYGSTLNNCIVYFNPAGSGEANYDTSSTLNYCCTMPLPTAGLGNIDLDPQLASASHLSANSPCRWAGSGDYAIGTDIDGEPWGIPPSIGCDEYDVGAVTKPLTVGLVANYTNVVVGYPIALTALIEGRTTASVWEFGDGVVVSNRPYASHAWAAAGDYLVALWAFNDSHWGGVSATVTVHVVAEPVVYVAARSTHPQPPYTSWATAATNIQDAVDAPLLGVAVVVVTNGVYADGGRDANRVMVDKPLAVRSVNGPQFTVINGGGVNRCAYLTDGASLSGFSLTNGWADSGGGVLCASQNAVLTNCVMMGNSAGSYGGGAYGGTLYNCTLTGNSGGYYGGGASWCTLYNCTLSGNSAGSSGYGGGAYEGTLYNCTLTGNSAFYGGGAYGSTLTNCIVYFNSSGSGGANYDTGSTLSYCCTTPLPTNGVGNIALDPQLASASRLSASSPCRWAGSAACATGTDIDGEPWRIPPSIGCDEYYDGTVTGPLAVEWRADRRAVTPGYTVAFIALIEGRPTASVWDFGDGVVVSNRPYANHAWTTPGDYAVVLRAYNDSQPGGASATGMVRVAVQPLLYVVAGSAHPVPPYSSWATAATSIQDVADTTVSGAVLVVSNGLYATGGRDGSRVNVDRRLTVRSVNGPLFTVIDGGGAVGCVYLANGASLSGFTLSNGLANNGGGVWCASTNAFLTNCTLTGNSATGGYGGGAYGGMLYNCTLTGNSAYEGGGASGSKLDNCALSGNSADYYGGGASGSTLYNCTLTYNWAQNLGGGAEQCVLSNCTLSGNWAEDWGGGADACTLYKCALTGNGAGHGGGANASTLHNCTLIGNGAGYGGGADASTLYNCTLTANAAYVNGGGAYGNWLSNCIVYFNTAPAGANYGPLSSALSYSCTTPLPTNGMGNITNAPLFVDYANGDLRLQSNSPCINAGDNAFVSGPTDLDGNPRIVGGTVDLGACEYQGTGSLMSYAWLQQYGLPTDGSADVADADADGMNNWQEWRCGTCPTNPLSALCLLSAAPAGTNVTVTWQSVAGVTYHLLRSTNLSGRPPLRLLTTNLPGQAGTTSYTDTNAARLAPLFYRVGVGNYVAPTNPPRPTLLCQLNGASRTLQITWSGTGFRLQSQTNGPASGLTTNWFDYQSGSASPVTVPVDPKNGAFFYRLVWP